MGFTFRKSFKIGPARLNVSKRGISGSAGAGGLRYNTGHVGGQKAKAAPEAKAGVGCMAVTIIVGVVAFIVWWSLH